MAAIGWEWSTYRNALGEKFTLTLIRKEKQLVLSGSELGTDKLIVPNKWLPKLDSSGQVPLGDFLLSTDEAVWLYVACHSAKLYLGTIKNGDGGKYDPLRTILSYLLTNNNMGSRSGIRELHTLRVSGETNLRK